MRGVVALLLVLAHHALAQQTAYFTYPEGCVASVNCLYAG